MTLSFENHCTLQNAFEKEGHAAFAAGDEGALGIALVSSGRCSVTENEAGGLAVAGNLLVWRGLLTLSPVGGCHLLGVSLCGGAAEEIAGGLASPLVLEGTAAPNAAELISRLSQLGLSQPEASAHGYALLCELAGADTTPVTLPPLVAAAMAHIREHYAEVYGIEELSAELNVSKSHLVRSFSAATGTTPGRYLTAVRVENAKRLLLSPEEYPLEVVASLCGFSGANYLCKVFKKETGETPAAWRETAAPRPTPGTPNDLEELMFL